MENGNATYLQPFPTSFWIMWNSDSSKINFSRKWMKFGDIIFQLILHRIVFFIYFYIYLLYWNVIDVEFQSIHENPFSQVSSENLIDAYATFYSKTLRKCTKTGEAARFSAIRLKASANVLFSWIKNGFTNVSQSNESGFENALSFLNSAWEWD